MQQIGGATAIAEDAEEPGIKALPLLVARERAIKPHEGFLDDVVRVRGVAQHPVRETHASRVVARDDGLERLDVAELRPTHERRIDGGSCGFRIGQRESGQSVCHAVSVKLNWRGGGSVTGPMKGGNRSTAGTARRREPLNSSDP